MGITSNASAGTFISISDAGTLKVTETHSGSTVAELRPSGPAVKQSAFNFSKQMGQEPALKEMVVLEQRKVLAICNSNG